LVLASTGATSWGLPDAGKKLAEAETRLANQPLFGREEELTVKDRDADTTYLGT